MFKEFFFVKMKKKQARKSSEDTQVAEFAWSKKFGPGKLRVEKVWAQNIFIDFLADLDKFQFFSTFSLTGFMNVRGGECWGW